METLLRNITSKHKFESGLGDITSKNNIETIIGNKLTWKHDDSTANKNKLAQENLFRKITVNLTTSLFTWKHLFEFGNINIYL